MKPFITGFASICLSLALCWPAMADSGTSAAEMATVIAQGDKGNGGITVDPASGDVEVSGEMRGEGEERNCTLGCLRWGKFCNVDPRGAYKCREPAPCA